MDGYSGDAGNWLVDGIYPPFVSNGRKFTTLDSDNDISSNNCAVLSGGGWWYGSSTRRCGSSHCSSSSSSSRMADGGTEGAVQVNSTEMTMVIGRTARVETCRPVACS